MNSLTERVVIQTVQDNGAGELFCGITFCCCIYIPFSASRWSSHETWDTCDWTFYSGLELGSNDGHIKRVASFLFHPIFPFVISVQQSFMQTSIVNFHFRRWACNGLQFLTCKEVAWTLSDFLVECVCHWSPSEHHFHSGWWRLSSEHT